MEYILIFAVVESIRGIASTIGIPKDKDHGAKYVRKPSHNISTDNL